MNKNCVYNQLYKIFLSIRCMKQVELPLLYGNYTWANGKCVEKPDATIVAVHTNVSGVIGYLLRRVVINQNDANRNHTSYPNLLKYFQVR